MLSKLLKGTVIAATVAIAATSFTTSVMAKDVLKVAVSSEAYPPFSSQNAKNEWEGFEIDLLAAVCKEMKTECKIVGTSWDGIIPSLNAKKVDAIFNSMSITEDRKKVIDFSDKYYNTPAEIMGGKDSPKLTTIPNPDGKGGMIVNPAELKGKTIGVQTATIHADYAKKYFTESTVKVYDTADNHNADLVAGRVDYVLSDSIEANEFLKSPAAKDLGVAVVVPADPVFGAGVGVGIRKADHKLKERFNAAIKAVRASGEYDAIAKKYFAFDIYGN